MTRRDRRIVPQRPRTRPALAPYRLRSGRILVARDVFGLARSLGDDRSATLWRLLRLSDGNRTVPEIASALRRARPGLDPAAVRDALGALARLGVVEDAADPDRDSFSPSEQERYSRNLDFLSLAALGTDRSSWESQARLRRARVTVLGVGAIGGATALSLAAMGVGHLRLIDGDRVERSNLNRQTLFTTADIGRPKVTAAVRRLRQLNPHCDVRGTRRRVRRPSEIARLMAGADLFVLGADQPHEIMAWANRAAFRVGVPWLDNGYAGARCAVALFVPGRTPCLECLEAHLERRLRRAGVAHGSELFPRDAANPVIAPTAGIAGHLGALQAIYYLLGLTAPAEGRLVQWNLWRPDDVRVERPRRRPGCRICGPAAGKPPGGSRRGARKGRGRPRGRRR